MIGIAYDAMIIVLAYEFPANLDKINDKTQFGATICSFLIVAISFFALIYLIVCQYIFKNTDLVNASEELKKLADMDPLTGLYNRRYLQDYLVMNMQTHKEVFYVGLLDLDNFKRVNDTYGHVYGDEVLKNFAHILKENINGNGIVARYGGEEFMVVFLTEDVEFIKKYMTKCQKEFIDFSYKTQEIYLTFSGGVEICRDQKKLVSLFNEADEKLYIAKSNGKNQVVFEKEA